MEYLQKAQKDIAAAQEMVRNHMARTVDEALELMKNQQSNIENGKRILTKEEEAEEMEIKTRNEAAKEQEGTPEGRVAKIEKVLEDFGKFFMAYKQEQEKKVLELSEQVKHFREEIIEVKTELTRAKQSARNEMSHDAPRRESQQTSSSSNPRQGSYASKDVEVEDIFSNAHNRLAKR